MKTRANTDSKESESNVSLQKELQKIRTSRREERTKARKSIMKQDKRGKQTKEISERRCLSMI